MDPAACVLVCVVGGMGGWSWVGGRGAARSISVCLPAAPQALPGTPTSLYRCAVQRMPHRPPHPWPVPLLQLPGSKPLPPFERWAFAEEHYVQVGAC